MRHETNNEMDLLLRRLARRDGGSMGDGEAQPDDRHLDADELSSFAQNALPAPARARYTEHLAECGSCRKLVTELSLSLGTTAAAPVETVSAPGGLKTFLASLFSPLVLRYAVPALGLLVAGVVGFVVLRQQQSETFSARLEQKQNQPAALAGKADASATSPSPAQFSDQSQKESDQSQKETGNRQQGEQRATSPSETKPQSRAAEERDAPAPVQPAKGEFSAAAEPQSSATPAPPAAPKVAAKSEEEAPQQTVVVAKKQPAAAAEQVTVDGQVSNAQVNERSYRGATPGSARADQDKDKKGTGDSTGFIGGVQSATRARSREAKDETETRSIAGRRFRKERGIWTDTAYDSSTATVNVTRGSEQFRGLVADEPEIETIAKQLDGEVIVVWKGRAYRIR